VNYNTPPELSKNKHIHTTKQQPTSMFGELHSYNVYNDTANQHGFSHCYHSRFVCMS